MFGIVFVGHNDLRRLLTDYGFKAFPLRKDFPLTGFYEIVYSYAEQIVVYIIVTLSQDFRKYYYENPWLGKKFINVENLTPSFVEELMIHFWSF
jgi:NADH-quinone oxidoreductase subunit C